MIFFASPFKLPPLFAGSILAILLVACRAEAQQQFKEMPAPAEAKTWGKVGTHADKKTVEDMVKGNATFDPKVVEKFFNELMYPHFTRSENFMDFAHRVDLPKMRRTARDYFNYAKTGPAHDKLNEITLKFMDDVAHDNYDPAARANAMIMIADLNETDPNGKPLKAAVPVLLKGVTAQTSIDAVRVPALRGLVRHAQAGIDASVRPQVMTTMLALVKERTPPAGRSADAHDWIGRRAIDVLVAMGEPGENGAVFDAMQKLIDDNSASVSLRAAAAAALANPKLTPPPNLDPAKLAKSVASLGIDAYKSELAEAASQFKPIAADRLKQHLGEIRRGLAGDGGKGGVLALSKTPPAQQYVNALVKEIDNLQTACNTAPLTQPIPPLGTASAGPNPVTPINTQEPLAKAIAQAGDSLAAALQRPATSASTEGALPHQDKQPLILLAYISCGLLPRFPAAMLLPARWVRLKRP